jgi:hypothetical protein
LTVNGADAPLDVVRGQVRDGRLSRALRLDQVAALSSPDDEDDDDADED